MIIVASIALAFSMTPNNVPIGSPEPKGGAISVESRERILELGRGVALRACFNSGDSVNKFGSSSWWNAISYSGLSMSEYSDVFGKISTSSESGIIDGRARLAAWQDATKMFEDRSSVHSECCGMTCYGTNSSLYDSINLSGVDGFVDDGKRVEFGAFAYDISSLPGSRYGAKSFRPLSLIGGSHEGTSAATGIAGIFESAGCTISHGTPSSYPKSVCEMAMAVGAFGGDSADECEASWDRFTGGEYRTFDDGWEYAVASAILPFDRYWWTMPSPQTKTVETYYDFALEPSYTYEIGHDTGGDYVSLSFSWSISQSEHSVTNEYAAGESVTYGRELSYSDAYATASVTYSSGAPERKEGGKTVEEVFYYLGGEGTRYAVYDAYCVKRPISVRGIDVRVNGPSAHSVGMSGMYMSMPDCDHVKQTNSVTHSLVVADRYRHLMNTSGKASISDSVEELFGRAVQMVVDANPTLRPTASVIGSSARINISAESIIDVFTPYGTYVASIYGAADVKSGEAYAAKYDPAGGDGEYTARTYLETIWKGIETVGGYGKKLSMSIFGRCDMARE